MLKRCFILPAAIVFSVLLSACSEPEPYQTVMVTSVTTEQTTTAAQTTTVTTVTTEETMAVTTSETTVKKTSVTTAKPVQTSAVTKATTAPPADGYTAEAGGNPADGTKNYIQIIVLKNRYYYNNGEVTFEELIKVIDELDENTAVKLKDDNAALRTYQKIASALEERGIEYIREK